MHAARGAVATKCIRPTAIGNALGDGIVDAMSARTLQASQLASAPRIDDTVLQASGTLQVETFASTAQLPQLALSPLLSGDAESLASLERFRAMNPTADASGNVFDIWPSDERGFFPESDAKPAGPWPGDPIPGTMGPRRNGPDAFSAGIARAFARGRVGEDGGETPWLLQRNERFASVNDWLNDKLVDFGRYSPTLAGAGQVARYGVFGDGTNLDAGFALLPGVGRLARGEVAALERFAVSGAEGIAERSALRVGDGATSAEGLRFSVGPTEIARRNYEPLTELQQQKVLDYAGRLGLPEEKITFWSGPTAYSPMTDTVWVGPNAFPGAPSEVRQSGMGVVDRLSMEATLAHEVVGHRNTALIGRDFPDGSLMDEVQASYRAAALAPELTSTERYQLLRDAVRRVHEQGLRVGDLDKSRFYLR
jgi:hypothetical protein